MIDTRSGYALARKGQDGRFSIMTDHRPASTLLLLNAYLDPIKMKRKELEEKGVKGLVIVRIIDNHIVEINE